MLVACQGHLRDMTRSGGKLHVLVAVLIAVLLCGGWESVSSNTRILAASFADQVDLRPGERDSIEAARFERESRSRSSSRGGSSLEKTSPPEVPPGTLPLPQIRNAWSGLQAVSRDPAFRPIAFWLQLSQPRAPPRPA